jgi:hypothetical protein
MIAALVLLLLATLQGGPVPPPRIDCAGQACPALEIDGDAPARLPNGRPSPFRGFADASVRRDPDSGELWMAYARPSVEVTRAGGQRRGERARSRPQVDTRLAASTDGGVTWRARGALWSPAPARSPAGEGGHWSHEVPNLLPVRGSTGTVWFGARLQYFLPDEGGFQRRPPESFRILLGRAASPRELAQAPAARLGSMATDPKWGMDVNLAGLSERTRHCRLWNEPALHHDGRELFLALSCMAFRNRLPDLARSDLVVFATSAQGDPSTWTWRFAGILAAAREASELGGERLTQVDLARRRDGTLIAVVTPDTWNEGAGDFVHHGCRVVAVEAFEGGLRLRRDAMGSLELLATVVASDAGPAGTAACTYEPASATGVILTKRDKVGGGISHAASLVASLHATRVHP